MKSMTGFGTAELVGKRGKISIEMRSYNHRFLDLRLRTSKMLQGLEPRIHLWARNRFVRGRVEIIVKLEESEGELPLKFNPAAVQFYLDLEQKLEREFNIPGRLDTQAILQLREVVSSREEAPESEDAWSELLRALEEAAARLESMQQEEGAALAADLAARFQFLSDQVQAVQSLSRDAPSRFREKLEERITRLQLDPIDPQRLAQEVLIYSDKIDITEEIVRLARHIGVCREGVIASTMTGKRLDFMAQEINRELNTIGSKSPNVEIVHLVVGMKSELEKIREQSQNIQ